MQFSKLTRGFYPSDLLDAYAVLPSDLQDMSDDDHAALIAAQSSGKIIDWSGDAPAAINAPAADPKVAIQAQIDAIERDSMTNRGARELQLELMREKGAANGLQSDEAIAAKVPYFKKLLALDVQIRALRAQL